MPDIVYRYKDPVTGRWIYLNEYQLKMYPNSIVYMQMEDGQVEDLGTVESLGLAQEQNQQMTFDQRLANLKIRYNPSTGRYEGGTGRIAFAAPQMTESGQRRIGNPQDNPENRLTREERLARMGFVLNQETGRWEAGRRQESTPYYTDENGVTRNVEPVSITDQVKRQVSSPVAITEPARKEEVISNTPIGQTNDGYVDTLLEDIQTPIPATIQTEGEPLPDSSTKIDIGDLSTIEPTSDSSTKINIGDLSTIKPDVNENESESSDNRVNLEELARSLGISDSTSVDRSDMKGRQMPSSLLPEGAVPVEVVRSNVERMFEDAIDQVVGKYAERVLTEEGGITFDSDNYDTMYETIYDDLVERYFEPVRVQINDPTYSGGYYTPDKIKVVMKNITDRINEMGRKSTGDENWEYIPSTNIQNESGNQQSLLEKIGEAVSKLVFPSEANATPLVDNTGNIVNITTPVRKEAVNATQNGYSDNQQKIMDNIRNIAKKYNIDENLLLNIAWNESRFNPNAKSNASTAKGLFQITNPTWKDLVKNYGSTHGITSTGVYDPIQNATGSALLLQGHQKAYEKAGIPVNNSTLYMGNFLGRTGAIRFLNEYYNGDPNKIAATSMVNAAEANPSLFYKDYEKYGTKYPRTYSELFDLMGNKLTMTF